MGLLGIVNDCFIQNKKILIEVDATIVRSELIYLGARAEEPFAMFRYNATHSGFVKDAAGPDTNNVLWTFNTTNSNTGNGVYSSPAIVGDTVYIGSGKGMVFAINRTTGAQIWNYSTIPGSWSHGQSCSPAVSNGKVFIGNDFRPQLWALNASNGQKLWNFSTGGAGMEGIYSSPTVRNGRVYFGTDSSTVFCLPENDPNSDGEIKMSEIYWKFDAADKVWSSPTVVGNRVYFGAGDANSAGANKLYSLYANNGTVDWTFPKTGDVQDILSAPAFVNGKLYFGSKDSKVYSIYANNGTEIWNYTTGGAIWGSAAVAYNRVFIGSLDNKLYSLNATTGAKIWDYTTGDEILSSPTVADRKVYFGSSDGKVYCLNATPLVAQKRWDYFISSFGNGICSSPSIVDGMLVIGGVDSAVPKVYAFREGDISPPTIISTYPADQEVDIPTTVTITITFSEPMDPLTIISSNIMLIDSSLNAYTGTTSYDTQTNTMSFDPNNILLRGENYTVRIFSVIKDVSGLGLDGNNNSLSEGSPLDDYIWEFTTSQNIAPQLTSPNQSPTGGGLDTDFVYYVTYTDLDNDTPILNPGYIKVFIDGEVTGRPMVLNPAAPPALRDGNFSNGELYIYTTKLSSYGMHTHQFKCSDGIDTNFTAVFDGPMVWFPQVLTEIPVLNAVEDIDLLLDLSDFIIDEDTYTADLLINEDSDYASVNETNITFNYPNEFNYPSGKTYEIMELTVYDPIFDYSAIQEVWVDVTAVNDPPEISGLQNITLNIDETYDLNVESNINDVDNTTAELTIITNSSYISVTGKVISFYYPLSSPIKTEQVKISVFDGELYAYQNITVTVLSSGQSFDLLTIPDQSAVEDIDLIFDIADYLLPEGTWINDAVIDINSGFGRVEGTQLIFNYPNLFVYPSGRTFEFVRLNITYARERISQSFRINVQAVNDGPELHVLSAPLSALEKTDIMFSVKYIDVDGAELPLVNLKLDQEFYTMDRISGNIHTDGGIYTREIQLTAGTYEYNFIVDDKMMSAQHISVNESETFTLKVIKYTETGNDTDGDSIPDAWELRYGLDPNDPSDASTDSDNDTFTNLQEYLGADGKPGGGDSSDPKDKFDLPTADKIDEEKGGDEKGSSSFLWVIFGIIAVILIFIIAFILVKRRKPKAVDDTLPPPPPPPPSELPAEPLEPLESLPQADQPESIPPPPMAVPAEDGVLLSTETNEADMDQEPPVPETTETTETTKPSETREDPETPENTPAD